MTSYSISAMWHSYLRAAQKVVKLDSANGGVGFEVWKLVSQQKSRHVGVLCDSERKGVTRAVK